MTLTLAEELVLLATDERGSLESAAWASLDNGIAGARLLELALAGRVALRDGAIAVVDERPTGDPLTDEALAEIADSARSRSARHWVGKLAKGAVRKRVFGRLDERGVLTPERGRVLGLVPRTRHVEADPEPERAVRARLRAVGLGEEPAPDARTAALASLVRACDLLGTVFERAERKEAKRRIGELASADVVGAAARTGAVTFVTGASGSRAAPLRRLPGAVGNDRSAATSAGRVTAAARAASASGRPPASCTCAGRGRRRVRDVRRELDELVGAVDPRLVVGQHA